MILSVMKHRGDYMHTLQSDYKYCEEIIKKHSKSFYFAFSRLEEQDRNSIYAVYAFCRLADDAVDEVETEDEKFKNIKHLQNLLEAFKQGNTPDGPVWRALRDVHERYALDLNMMALQLEGQEMDVDFKQPENIDELEVYSEKVAGSVGLLLLPIICNNELNQRAKQASSLGVAMQYTNILRDVGEDISYLDRVYLPKDMMNSFGVTVNQLKAGRVDENFIKLWESIAQLAEEKYEAFLEEINHYKAEAQYGLLLAVNVYREILSEVRRNNYDCFKEKHFVSKTRKAIIATEVMALLNQLRKENVYE